MAASVSLESIPQEVLEHIAFFAATQGLVGPPADLPPLLLTCRKIYQALSCASNPYLYARIFISGFDTNSALRRLGSRISAPRILANELKKRWTHLKRIRTRTNSRIPNVESYNLQTHSLIDLLWLAYLMMLENDGKNERQLLDYAEMDIWLLEYWFAVEGASGAVREIQQFDWPVEDEKNSIAMWLFWFLLRPDVITRNADRFPHMMAVLKLVPLAANHYPICYPHWTTFLPRSDDRSEFLPQLREGFPSRVVTHFSETYRLSPPTLAPVAILAFLTTRSRMLVPARTGDAGTHYLQFPTHSPLTMRRSEDWDTDWHRCINLGPPNRCRTLSEAYVLGSMEGVWEGVFTYTDFSAYSTLLSGGAPSALDNCLVAQHRQTWKLREYYLAYDQEPARERPRPLRPGDPLKAYFPAKTRLQELSDSVEIQEPGQDAIHYQRLSNLRPDSRNVIDVIILGEGHSAWGQFILYGRVRLLDGLMSFSKEYVEGERGRWLYRGYLVGNVDGYISGRWRDTMTPSDVEGYEGCFVMSRRR